MPKGIRIGIDLNMGRVAGFANGKINPKNSNLRSHPTWQAFNKTTGIGEQVFMFKTEPTGALWTALGADGDVTTLANNAAIDTAVTAILVTNPLTAHYKSADPETVKASIEEKVVGDATFVSTTVTDPATVLEDLYAAGVDGILLVAAATKLTAAQMETIITQENNAFLM